jgi:hypothetical protein
MLRITGKGKLCAFSFTAHSPSMILRFLQGEKKPDAFSFAGVPAANEKNNNLCDLSVLSEAGGEWLAS